MGKETKITAESWGRETAEGVGGRKETKVK